MSRPAFSPEGVTFGVCLVALGVLWTLGNLGRVEMLPVLRTWWPLSFVLCALLVPSCQRDRAPSSDPIQIAKREAKAFAALVADGWAATAVDDVLRVAAGAARAADLNRAATAAGITLSRLIVAQDNLEEIFLEMTGRVDGELADGRAATNGKVA